jgi:subtilisin family serine protease
MQAHQDFVNKWQFEGNPTGWDQPTQAHGTNIAGVMVGKDTGVVNLTSLVKLRFVRYNAQDSVATILALLDQHCTFADGAAPDIISMSYGGEYSQAEENMINKKSGQGIVLVAAAGNNHNESLITDDPQFPASLQNVISVAAVKRDHYVAQFSQRTPKIDIAAPGYDLLTADTTSPTDRTKVSGTSYACPLVALMIGVLRAVTDPAIISTQKIAEYVVGYGLTVVTRGGITLPDQTTLRQDAACFRKEPSGAKTRCSDKDVGRGVLNIERAYQAIMSNKPL